MISGHQFKQSAMTDKFECRNEFFQNLRSSQIQAQKERNHYKKLYSSQCKKNKLLDKQVKTLKRHYSELQMRFENLRNKFSLQHDKRECTHPTRKRKPWSQIKSDRTQNGRD